MRTTNFDAIGIATPLNREASVVRDGSGETFVGKVPSWHDHWTAPPIPEGRRPDDKEDLTGRAFGRLTVIRYHKTHKKDGSRWLVRCTCGDYELRRSRTIRDAAEDAMCAACGYFEHVKVARERERKGLTAGSADAARLDQLAGAK